MQWTSWMRTCKWGVVAVCCGVKSQRSRFVSSPCDRWLRCVAWRVFQLRGSIEGTSGPKVG